MTKMLLVNLITGLALLLPLATAQGDTVNITLPWGTYQSDELLNGSYTFRNVRFGRNMSGHWRFRASEYPARISDNSTVIQETGARCIQASDTGTCIAKGSNGGASGIIPPGTNYIQGEDCLFLDLYVPQAAMQNAAQNIANFPVVVWVFGGAFIFGAKDYNETGPPLGMPFFNATGPMLSGNNKFIFVAGNYRLGAFGWLAGRTMEKHGTPNAGLTDQRLVFRWVHDHIHLVGGNNANVTAWGESAGASSLLHHLIARDPATGELQPPLFSRAALQSPAYEWIWDNETMEQTYQSFSAAANCTLPCDIEYLRNQTSATLISANQELVQENLPCDGLFPIGPSIDHQVITSLAPVALSGTPGVNFSVIDSIIVSHCANESARFIPPSFYWTSSNTPNETTMETFLGEFIPELRLKKIIPKILDHYSLEKYGNNQTTRVASIIADAVFVCNTRFLFDAYSKTATDYYAFQWAWPTSEVAIHGSDLAPLFFNQGWNLTLFLISSGVDPEYAQGIYDAFNDTVAPNYQDFWVSHALSGNPNQINPTLGWTQANLTADGLINTMYYGNYPPTGMSGDEVNTKSNCDFWNRTAFEVEHLIRSQRLAIDLEQQQVILPHNDEL